MPFGLTFNFKFSSSFFFFFLFTFFSHFGLQYVDKNKKKSKRKLFPIEINSEVPMSTLASPNSVFFLIFLY